MSKYSGRAKSHQRVGEGNKMDYKEWQVFRADIDTLRNEFGMSWRQISKAAGGGRNAGWAVKCYEHRGLLDQRGADSVRALVDRKRAEAVGFVGGVGVREDTGAVVTPGAIRAMIQQEAAIQRAGGPPPSPPPPPPKLAELRVPGGETQKLAWYHDVVRELRETYRMNWDEVGAVFGYGGASPGNSANAAYNQNHVPKDWRLERAREILAEIRAGRAAEANNLMRKPAPMPKEQLQQGDQKYVAQPTDLRRIGPEAHPSRVVPSRSAMLTETKQEEAPKAEAPAPAPAPAPPVPRPEPPARKPEPKPTPQAATNGKHPVTREERLTRLKDRLMQVALEDFEEMASSEPKFIRSAWEAKQAELISFIDSLE